MLSVSLNKKHFLPGPGSSANIPRCPQSFTDPYFDNWNKFFLSPSLGSCGLPTQCRVSVFDISNMYIVIIGCNMVNDEYNIVQT